MYTDSKEILKFITTCHIKHKHNTKGLSTLYSSLKYKLGTANSSACFISSFFPHMVITWPKMSHMLKGLHEKNTNSDYFYAKKHSIKNYSNHGKVNTCYCSFKSQLSNKTDNIIYHCIYTISLKAVEKYGCSNLHNRFITYNVQHISLLYTIYCL